MRTPLRRLVPLALATVAAALTALATPAVSNPAAGDCTPGGDWPAARADLAGAVLSLVNAHRATVGAPALVTSETLTAAAVWKARHMAKYGYMAHDDPAPPVARTTADRIAACGYGGAGWGENIAYGYPTAQAVMTGWLGSPGHRANIEQAAFRATGIGAAVAPNGAVYWAQTFGTSTAGAVPPPPPPPPTTTTTPPPTTTTPPPATTTTTPTTTTPPPTTPPAPRVPGRRPASLHVGRSPDRRSPRVDRRFVLRFPVAGLAQATKLSVGCSARVGHRQVRVLASWLGGRYAHCVLVAPRRTRGWHLWGTVRVNASQQHARRWFSRLVR